MYSTLRHFHCFGAILCLLLVLTACTQQSGNGSSPGVSPTTTSSTSSPTHATAVQTCPAQATARAAVMPSLAKASSFTPWPSKHYLIYIPMKWANNSVYLLGTVRGSGGVPHQLALLRDINKDVSQQASNLQIITAASQDNDCQDYDVTPDNQQSVCSAYTLLGQSPQALLQCGQS